MMASSPRPERRPIRLPVVDGGRTYYPYLGELTPEGVGFYHGATKTHAPLCWRQLVQAGADAQGVSAQEFLSGLAADMAAPAAPAPSSDLSVPTSESSNADRRRDRRKAC